MPPMSGDPTSARVREMYQRYPFLFCVGVKRG